MTKLSPKTGRGNHIYLIAWSFHLKWNYRKGWRTVQKPIWVVCLTAINATSWERTHFFDNVTLPIYVYYWVLSVPTFYMETQKVFCNAVEKLSFIVTSEASADKDDSTLITTHPNHDTVKQIILWNKPSNIPVPNIPVHWGPMSTLQPWGQYLE